jgi:hypothetical protein
MMDLEVAHKIGDGCPYLLKFYGALHAEVFFFNWIFLKECSLKFYSFKVSHLDFDRNHGHLVRPVLFKIVRSQLAASGAFHFQSLVCRPKRTRVHAQA